MKQQPLPRCHRHPTKGCPGECQYILASDECMVEIRDRDIALKTMASLEVLMVAFARNPAHFGALSSSHQRLTRLTSPDDEGDVTDG